MAKKCILFKSWLEKGVYCIGHVIDEEGQFYKYIEFIKKYNIQVNYLEYFGCVQAIKTNEMVINPRSLTKIYNQVKGTQFYYDVLTEDGKSLNCCSKWEIKLGEGTDWKACFKKTKKIQEVKLKWFQIRLLHRILTTNIVLKEMGIAQDVLCNFSNLERDSIQHCMWRCQHVKLF